MTQKYGKLIGIIGYAGSGKTSLTTAALERWNGPRNTIRIGFTDPLYEMLKAMGVSPNIVDDKKRWNEPVDVLCGHSVRYAITTLGTEWGREYLGQDVWTRAAMKRANKYREHGTNVVIDNVRFHSEFNGIYENAGECIKLIRPGLEINLDHESERHILDLQRLTDYEIVNDGTFTEGMEKLRKIIIDIIEQPPI